MAKNDIIQELSELESSFSNVPARNIYSVPQGYFDGLAGVVLNRIKALDATHPQEELNYLSPFLNDISRELPFSVPQDYFRELPDTVMEGIRNHEDYQTAEEEISSISPLLSSIGNKNPYGVPEGYFENFGKDINLRSDHKPAAKVVSLVNRKWFRLAAAAVVIGFVAMTGINLFFNGHSIPTSNTHRWVEENMKKVSTAEMNNFIQADDEESKGKDIATAGTADIRELMKDVSDNDIQDFLNKTNAGNDESESDADILLN